MKKVIKIILLILLIISICVLMIFGCYKVVVTTNQKRYKETPVISEIEEYSKRYILGNWLKSGLELEFVTQELIGENILVYYFKVVEPKKFYAFGTRTFYVKAVCEFQYTDYLFYKHWQFDKVMTSHYEEIESLLEVKDE